MDFRMYQNRLSQLSARFNLMVCLVFGLLLSNIILSLFVCIAWRQRTIEITPFAGSSGYIKGASFIDSHYLSLMAENFINERLNVSPETVDVKHKRLLSYVNPSEYSYFLKQLALEAQAIKEKKMSSSFDITAIQVNTSQLTARVSGRQKRYVGIQNIDDAPKVYELQFHYAASHLSITQFALKKETDHA